jgi:hypothetical protein
LSEDPVLLRRFVKWIVGGALPKSLRIVEQRLPGEFEQSEAEYEQLGLPDCWIHDEANWSLLIESKISSPLEVSQLRRHLRTANRRGFESVSILAIDVASAKKNLPGYVIFRTWREIYSWLRKQSAFSEWANRVARYMEVADRKFALEGYLREGTLTEFAGIHFDESNPYGYGEAKRLIRLIMDDLRCHPGLKGTIDVTAPGRKAITGKGQTAVWDFLRLKSADKGSNHTRQPHFTVVINQEELLAFLNVPNSMEGRYRKPIVELGEEGFFDVLGLVNKNLIKISDRVAGSYPFANMVQRRFASQRSKATVDGRMHFDLRTAFPGGSRQEVKVQEQWLRAMHSLIIDKRSNLEWTVGMAFPYEKCEKTKSPKIVDALVDSWIACRPLLDVLETSSKT